MVSALRQKTLFKKYISISLTIILLSFSILGIMLILFVNNYSIQEEKNKLRENADIIAEMIGNNAEFKAGTIYIDEKIYRSVVETMAQNISADIMIVNTQGVVQITSNKEIDQRNIQPETVMVTQSEDYFDVGNLDGIYSSDHYISGAPLYIQVVNTPAFTGAVFVASSIENTGGFTSEITNIFLLAAVATFFISFCFVGFFTYNMVRPLRAMSNATKALSNGDFSVRVPVTSKDEIGELATAFNNMADSLSQSEGSSRAFVANVSHELKTPMTTIAGFIDGILDGTIPKERQSYYLNIVSIETRRLSRLVQSMLSLSRIDSGSLKLNKSEFDLRDIIINTFLTFEQKIDDKKIIIKGFENLDSTMVKGDADMIHQVVYNLVENAVKFTNENGYIEVIVNVNVGATAVEIRNSGEGIPPQEVLHIFERFYKTDKSRSKDKEGMGLGLYIVKTIMRLHGGDITAKSELYNYTSFTFWIPKDEIIQVKEKTLRRENKNDKLEGV